MAWKLEFDAKRLQGKEKKAKKDNKLTGRELFTQNSKLNESDLQFISSGNNNCHKMRKFIMYSSFISSLFLVIFLFKGRNIILLYFFCRGKCGVRRSTFRRSRRFRHRRRVKRLSSYWWETINFFTMIDNNNDDDEFLLRKDGLLLSRNFYYKMNGIFFALLKFRLLSAPLLNDEKVC